MSFGDYMKDYRVEDFYSAAPAEWLNKADDPVLTTTSNYTNTVYGPTWFNWLSMDLTGIFGILPKAPWPADDGIRVVTGRTHRHMETAENTALPDSDKATVLKYRAPTKFHTDRFELSRHAEANRNDNVGGSQLSFLRESTGQFHVDNINYALGLDAETSASALIRIEALDRVIASSSEATACKSGSTATAWNPYGSPSTYTDPLTRGGTGINTAGDSQVIHNSGVDRALTLSLLDECLIDCEAYGLKRDKAVWITGRDTAMQLGRLLGARERFVNQPKRAVGFGGVTQMGADTGFEVATYHGIPVLPVTSIASDGASRIYLVDTDNVGIRVELPTVYKETDDWLLQDNMKRQGAYFTGAELITTNPTTSGKVRDIAA